MLELAKTSNTTTLLIGHVTKDGTLAGPRVLEHLVDTVLSLEGDRYQQFRMLRASKNRFGNCSEVGIFEMTEKGLSEVKNPSQQFLEGRSLNAIGSIVTVAMEGTRPFLVEVQALVSTTHFGYPKRTANGFDLNRLQILIAILEKYGRLNLQNQDIFINIVGGMYLEEPAADLAILIAIASSYLKKPIPTNTVVFGEAGLSGELRTVPHTEKRLKEAQKLGFQNIISPEKFKKVFEAITSI
jgi:DNA repair protein RadA/Sms